MSVRNLILNVYSDHEIDQVVYDFLKEESDKIRKNLNYYKNEYLSYLKSNLAFNIKIEKIKDEKMKQEILKELMNLKEKTKEALKCVDYNHDLFSGTKKIKQECHSKYESFFTELKKKRKDIERLIF